MADLNKNLNSLALTNYGDMDIDQNPNTVKMTLKQKEKEAIFQIPIEKVQDFIINGINNIIIHGKFLQSTAAAAYDASVRKSSELIANLSKLLLEAFDNVNENLDIVSKEITNIKTKLDTLEGKCYTMWDNHDTNHKENETKLEDIKTKNNEYIKKCEELRNDSKKKIEEINKNLARNSKTLNSKYETLNNNVDNNNKRLD